MNNVARRVTERTHRQASGRRSAQHSTRHATTAKRNITWRWYADKSTKRLLKHQHWSLSFVLHLLTQTTLFHHPLHLTTTYMQTQDGSRRTLKHNHTSNSPSQWQLKIIQGLGTILTRNTTRHQHLKLTQDVKVVSLVQNTCKDLALKKKT